LAYSYVLDIEVRNEMIQEADDAVIKFAKIWGKYGTILEVFSPQT